MSRDRNLPEDLVGGIEPHSVIVYAKAHGWEPAPRNTGRLDKLALFRRVDQPSSFHQLIVPMEPSYEDFARRMADAIVKLVESDQVESLLDPQRDPAYAPSANLCDALLRIQPEETGASLALSASWSSFLPPPPELSSLGPVQVRSDYRRVIQDVYLALLPSDRDMPPTLFLGHVDTMNGNPDADGRMSGEIVVSVLAEDMKAHLELDAADYARALDAHARHAAVKFRGRLIRGTRKHRIDSVSGFSLVE
jgi:hypothetical protein